MYSINVSEISEGYDFEITGCSYIGNPIDSTVMYMTEKIEHQLSNLQNSRNCLVFVETSVNVPEELKQNNCFVHTDNPQLEYANFVARLHLQKVKSDRERPLKLMEGGYYLGENVRLGKNCIIEPNCIIGHDVQIGDNAQLMFGTVIRNAVIGTNFIANEHAVIGAYAFTMARDERGSLIRIPTMGLVEIGDEVEVGAFNNLSCGTAGNTVLGNNVKLDAFVHVGHDVRIDDNVEIPAGVVISGFVKIGSNSFIGVNSSLRNRITIGERVVIGMGAVVTKNVESDSTVVGNPAKPLIK